MALEDGNLEADLARVLDHDRLRGHDRPVDDRLDVRGLDLGHLGRQVARLGVVHLVGGDRDAVLRRELLDLPLPRVPEAVVAGEDADLGDLHLLHLLEDLDDRVTVLLGGLEHLLRDGVDDRLGRRAGQEDGLPRLRDALDLHRLAARRGTDDGEHLVFVDQLLGEGEGLLRAGAGILDDQLDLACPWTPPFLFVSATSISRVFASGAPRNDAGPVTDRIAPILIGSAAWANVPDRKTASRTANTIPFLPFISLSFRSLGSSLRPFRSIPEKSPNAQKSTIMPFPRQEIIDTLFY